MAHILLIDDDVSLCEMLRSVLERLGHSVTEAHDGDKGLAAERQSAIDLVITDLLMPGKEGIETIIELRKRSPSLKIIAMSGGGRGTPGTYLTLASKFGANRLLPKPFSIAKFSATLAETLAVN